MLCSSLCAFLRKSLPLSIKLKKERVRERERGREGGGESGGEQEREKVLSSPIRWRSVDVATGQWKLRLRSNSSVRVDSSARRGDQVTGAAPPCKARGVLFIQASSSSFNWFGEEKTNIMSSVYFNYFNTQTSESHDSRRPDIRRFLFVSFFIIFLDSFVQEQERRGRKKIEQSY